MPTARNSSKENEPSNRASASEDSSQNQHPEKQQALATASKNKEHEPAKNANGKPSQREKIASDDTLPLNEQDNAESGTPHPNQSKPKGFAGTTNKNKDMDSTYDRYISMYDQLSQ